MSSKFISEMPLAGVEVQMQQVPGFKPRRSGISVSRLDTQKLQGGPANRQAEGQKGDCGTPGGDCRRFSELIGHFTREVAFAPFADRVSHLEDSVESAYRDEGHQERFLRQWQAAGDAPDGDAMCAALYLLTADNKLWEMAAQAVQPELIDFASICIRGVGLDGYVLFHTAKDLYKGTNRLSLSELTDPKLISDLTFWTVINAFLIRRYGAGLLSEERRHEC